MLTDYRVVYRGGEGEITEKKSRFIATVSPAETEEEALEFIDSMKKKYWNATHNCSAYVLGERNEIQRCSDDGEPSQTAGKPMLDVLVGEKIHNAAVVVTRYFGGTLLGTGGLVRAYAAAAKAGLASSVIITKKAGVKLEINIDYTDLGKIQYILGEGKFQTVEVDYTERVKLAAMIPRSELEQVMDDITEGTGGRAELVPGEVCYYAKIDQELVLL